MARCLTTVANESEAQVVVERLADAGIHGWSSGIVRVTSSRDVYVEDADLERARAVLQGLEGITEAELVQAEEEDAAAREARIAARARRAQAGDGDPGAGRPRESGAAPSPKRSLWERMLKRPACRSR